MWLLSALLLQVSEPVSNALFFGRFLWSALFLNLSLPFGKIAVVLLYNGFRFSVGCHKRLYIGITVLFQSIGQLIQPFGYSRYKSHIRRPVPFLPCRIVGFDFFLSRIIFADFLCRQIHAVFVKDLQMLFGVGNMAVDKVDLLTNSFFQVWLYISSLRLNKKTGKFGYSHRFYQPFQVQCCCR